MRIDDWPIEIEDREWPEELEVVDTPAMPSGFMGCARPIGFGWALEQLIENLKKGGDANVTR